VCIGVFIYQIIAAGGFYAPYLRYVILPGLLLGFCFVPLDTQQRWFSHENSMIGIYVFFGVWAALAIWTIVDFFRFGLYGDFFSNILPSILQLIAYPIACVSGFFYCKNIIDGGDGKAPLISEA
jgi:hypothetical protein